MCERSHQLFFIENHAFVRIFDVLKCKVLHFYVKNT